MRRRRRKGAGQPALERGIRWIVRPQRENAAGVQMRGKPRQPFGLVERGMVWVQQVLRRMVDNHTLGLGVVAILRIYDVSYGRS